jgi:hypothetical protein
VEAGAKLALTKWFLKVLKRSDVLSQNLAATVESEFFE